ncbi:peroxisomal N(1)-acetyl-spermine/spermidine oxidase-like [Paramacrobiotus metropolitanus]|uniref:peroxisomal N(1)-acetyl-spermine/spermidine oxidase-like n=1 Tax=Paramacrobiotus metropolitanus TaxID=2943436 RepID=UPI002445F46E|nr:peroxisomal N(1)-acetyl-spermine/spermidine oxidase-like [Paramacrobiotus metropolitanus]
METPKIKAKVVVVGAGAAGIAAATLLFKNNFDVIVYEASDRIGGRMRTHKTPEGWIELGAQWVHGEQQWLYDYAAEHGLLGRSVVMAEESGILQESGKQVSVSDFGRLSEKSNVFGDMLCKDELRKVDKLQSVGEFLTNIYYQTSQDLTDLEKAELESAYDWFIRVTKMDAGSDTLHDVNVRNYIDETCIGNYNHQLNIPFADLFDHVRNYPKEGKEFPLERVKFNTAVAALKFLPENKQVQVTTAKGEVIEADHVIVTVSLGVLKAHQHTLFQTPLPARTKLAIDLLGYGTVGKVVCFYDEPFWKDWKFDYVRGDVKALSLFWKGDLDDFQNDPEKRYDNKPWYRAIRSFVVAQFHPNVLVAFLAGSHTNTMEKLSEDDVSRDITALLRRFSGRNVPAPKKIIRSSWSCDKNFNGTYSYLSQAARKAEVSAEDLGQPAWKYEKQFNERNVQVPGLLFAGEATHTKYFSMAHGALMSGWREAQRLIDGYSTVHI